MTPACKEGEAAVHINSAASTSSTIAKTIISVKKPSSAATTMAAALLNHLHSRSAPSTADSRSGSSTDGTITNARKGRVLGVGPHTPTASRLDA